MSLLIIAGTIIVGALIAVGTWIILRDTDQESVLLVAEKPQTDHVQIREAPVDGRCAYWDEEHNDEEPLPITLEPSKIKNINGKPGYYVDLSTGDVYSPCLDKEHEGEVEVDRIDAETLRAEQMSTTIQDIADAADSQLQAMAQIMPYAAGVMIFLLIAIIVIVMR